ncbi:MAG: RnfH family protein [Betaproteobacteria bacterium]
MISVSVVYALPDAATEIELQMAPRSTIADALADSRIAERLPGVDLGACDVGIFGKRKARDAPLADGDRVEIYRRLIADPKQARRERARRAGE